jgi:hypothetical protein
MLLGMSREEVDHRFDKIAAFADIGEYLDQPVKTYSSGMLVRLAFAVQVQIDRIFSLWTRRWRLAMRSFKSAVFPVSKSCCPMV